MAPTMQQILNSPAALRLAGAAIRRDLIAATRRICHGRDMFDKKVIKRAAKDVLKHRLERMGR